MRQLPQPNASLSFYTINAQLNALAMLTPALTYLARVIAASGCVAEKHPLLPVAGLPNSTGQLLDILNTSELPT